MQLSLGGGVQVTNERGIRMTTQHGGVVRIMLNDVPEGKYKVLINYFEKPNGADFQVWQRQKQLSGWISTKKDKEVSKRQSTCRRHQFDGTNQFGHFPCEK